ncbi:HlyD family secretion protein [Steroidobacter sp.]|uniref:HlyD family secretion protein n=1 Tax=Steroidobacter sp. TaxID=1978227 RepID=UPI001A47D7E3|nr:HlyD family efflux transporter periplasmic adaptor subunit [Steroidobacter sp.]MBL8271673.1 HlyD family efflux transporter periplasmic adaptor subunit [Steroidobacter sp.]
MKLRTLVCWVSVCWLSACSRSDEGQILGTLERDRLELIAEANEPIVSIDVHEGDVVPAGAVLLRQELGAMQAKLDQAAAARNVAERRLAELTKGPRSQEILEARAGAESAQSSLLTETKEYERVRDLVERKLLSQSSLDQARARRDTAIGSQKQTTARLNLLLEGTRIEELEQAEASLKQAQAALAEVQTSAARYVVTAPRAGRIEAIPYKLGERPATGAPVIVMLADGVPYARVHVPEPVRAQFKSGTEVQVRLDGRDQPLQGVVRYVSADAAFTPYYALTQEDRSRLSFLAEVDLPEDAARDIPSGIPVQVMLTETAK